VGKQYQSNQPKPDASVYQMLTKYVSLFMKLCNLWQDVASQRTHDQSNVMNLQMTWAAELEKLALNISKLMYFIDEQVKLK
jgi:hypothetical protein